MNSPPGFSHPHCQPFLHKESPLPAFNTAGELGLLSGLYRNGMIQCVSFGALPHSLNFDCEILPHGCVGLWFLCFHYCIVSTCVYTTIYWLILLLMSIGVLSSFGFLSMNILKQSNAKPMDTFLSGINLGVQLLNLRRCTAEQFSKVVASDIFLCEKNKMKPYPFKPL